MVRILVFGFRGIFFVNLALLFIACKKEADPDPRFRLNLIFHHQSLGIPLSASGEASDSAGTQIQFSRLQYYLSNIRLESDNPMDVFAEPSSYHLIKGLDNSGKTMISIGGIPYRNYRYLHLGIGLDSLSNKGGKVGIPALEAGSGMYWSWSDEYKFMVLEGLFQKPDTAGAFLFHITGNSSYRPLRISLLDSTGNVPVFRPENTLNLDVEISSLFGAPNPIDFRTFNNVMSVEAGAGKIAANYGAGRFVRLRKP
jgi:hypothetical protein